MALLGLVFVLSACTLAEREKGYPGGNIGFAADQQLFARGHEERVARYVIAMALISPLIAETAETPIEAKLSAERLDAMYGRLERLLRAAKNCDLSLQGSIVRKCSLSAPSTAGTSSSAIADSAYSFETLSLDVSVSLYKATEQVVSALGVRTGVRGALRANRLNPTQLLQTVLGLRRILPTVLKYYATYRDVAVIVGESALQRCVGAELQDPSCQKLVTAFEQLSVRAKPGKDSLAPIQAVFDASYDRINAGKGWKLNRTHYLALMYHVDRACFTLVQIQQQDAGLGTPKDCRVGSGRGAGAQRFHNYITANLR